ncbi:hypothetical protein [Bifidobacterium choladohabitans]|uniref:Uncharacterized protein n=1 Tax=Bifidobacterium asteroides TaxID=1684 RepID=A0A2N3R9K0_9BIFI|nr:hypothetical protein [Bifidobacterium choladohabitans]PKV09042.1 hypothetical protein CQR44_1360 [Bifidobacterium asteroides]
MNAWHLLVREAEALQQSAQKSGDYPIQDGKANDNDHHEDDDSY